MNSVRLKKPALDGAAAPALDQTEPDKLSALLHLALEAGRSIAWDWNVRSGQDSWFGDLQSVFGIASTALIGHVEDFRRRVHPQDRELVWRAVNNAMENRTLYVAEFRIVRLDGSVVWLAAQGKFYYSSNGEPERMLGIGVDITERKASAEALRRKDMELAEARQLAGVGTWSWNADDDSIIWSDELYRIMGRDPRLPAVRLWETPQFLTPESLERLRHAIEEAQRAGTQYELDLQVIRADRSTRWITARGEIQRDPAGNTAGMRGTLQDITERKRTEEALSTLGRKLIGAQEAERAEIARNLHDDVGQRFTVILATLDQLKRGCGPSMDSADSRFVELRRQIMDVSRSINTLSHELHSASLRHLGMTKAIRGFCRELSEQQQVEVAFSDSDVPGSIPQETALCLFRIVQEALHNAVKHSQTRRLAVDVRGTSTAILLTVRDSGVGFDPEEAMNGRGLGLISMQERMKLVHGELTIESRPGSGTAIHARVPLR